MVLVCSPAHRIHEAPTVYKSGMTEAATPAARSGRGTFRFPAA
jgi:hypothetical protein